MWREGSLRDGLSEPGKSPYSCHTRLCPFHIAHGIPMWLYLLSYSGQTWRSRWLEPKTKVARRRSTALSRVQTWMLLGWRWIVRSGVGMLYQTLHCISQQRRWRGYRMSVRSYGRCYHRPVIVLLVKSASLSRSRLNTEAGRDRYNRTHFGQVDTD